MGSVNGKVHTSVKIVPPQSADIPLDQEVSPTRV